MKNEMYVEKLAPVGRSTKPFPLLFIHELGQTATVSRFLFAPFVTEMF